MTPSDLFTAAHKLTRETIQDGDSYAVTFGACLRHLRARAAEEDLSTLEGVLKAFRARLPENSSHSDRVALVYELKEAGAPFQIAVDALNVIETGGVGPQPGDWRGARRWEDARERSQWL